MKIGNFFYSFFNGHPCPDLNALFGQQFEQHSPAYGILVAGRFIFHLHHGYFLTQPRQKKCRFTAYQSAAQYHDTVADLPGPQQHIPGPHHLRHGNTWKVGNDGFGPKSQNKDLRVKGFIVSRKASAESRISTGSPFTRLIRWSRNLRMSCLKGDFEAGTRFPPNSEFFLTKWSKVQGIGSLHLTPQTLNLKPVPIIWPSLKGPAVSHRCNHNGRCLFHCPVRSR